MPSLGKFIKHTSQWNDKFQVDLQIHTAFGVKNQSPTPHYFVSYKRGDHKGSSMKLTSADPHTVTFDQTCCFTFPCTLYYYDVAKKDYEEKVLTVFFNEECADDPLAYIIHGKANIDLAKYAKEVPLNSSKSFPLTEVMSKPKKGEALKLQVTLTLTCVSINELPKEPVVEASATPTPIPSTPIRVSSTTNFSTPTSTPISIPASSTPISIQTSTPINIPATEPIQVSTYPTSSPIRMDSAGSIPSISGLTSFSAPARSKGDDESVSSFSSRTSPPSSPSSSPSNSPPRFSTSIEDYMHHSRNGSYNSDRGSSSGRRSRRTSGNFTPPAGVNSLQSSASSSNVKSYLQSPPVKMHLLERQASDSLLNTSDIARRLASKHPELCKSKDGTPVRVESVKAAESNSRPSSPHRRALDFKNEGKVRSISDFKPSAEAIQKQKDDEKFLIEEVIPLPPTFSESGIPVLAYVLFRTLLQWQAFHSSNAAFLDAFFKTFNNLVDIPPADLTRVLLYRLSSAATLLHILRTELKILSTDNGGSTVLKDFGRRLKKSLNTFYSLYYSKVKQELDDAIQTVLGNIRDDKASGVLTSVFDQHLKLVQSSICFESLRQQIIYQIFYYFNAKIFNSLLQKTTPCQCAVGLGLKMAIQQAETWATAQNDQQTSTHPEVSQVQCSSAKGWVYDILRRACHPARQAADVLVVTKSTLVEPKIRDEVCPSLTPRQLLLLLEQYVPDDFDPEPIHPGVLKAVSEEASGEYKPSYQAEEPVPTIDVAQPIGIDAHFSQVLSLTSIPIPSILADNPSFSFLNILCADKSNQPW